MKYSGWPESGELVVGRVDEIEDFGVFVDLLEYEDKRGLCHISEVASGWIKNVRDHVNTDQRVVAKVLDVDESAQQIDLSIKDVSDHQQKNKIQEWKNEQKADNWMEIAFGEDISDDDYATIANTLLADFGSLYDGFEQAAIHGHEALEDVDLSDEQLDAIVDTAREQVSVPYVTVSGYVDLTCPAGDGVDSVQEALQAAEGDGESPVSADGSNGTSEDGSSGIPDEVELKVTYVGAPEYRIEVQAPDYKTAEDQLEASADRAAEAIAAHGGTGEFHRERRSDDE
jgi:translation initiation factor 2 subunit 1